MLLPVDTPQMNMDFFDELPKLWAKENTAIPP
jgi:hypothetical protein